MPKTERKESKVAGDAWLDISMPLKNGMVTWPGDPPFNMHRVFSIDRGDEENISFLLMSTHNGTHLDAPLHYLRGGAALDEIPFDTLIGPVRVIEIRDPRVVTPEELRKNDVHCGERILLKTKNSARGYRSGKFRKNFVHLTREAARFLAQTTVRMVGVDYLSVGGLDGDSRTVHQELLGSLVWILEGLDLSRVRPGIYDFICLPLNIPGADGAPARALLRPLS